MRKPGSATTIGIDETKSSDIEDLGDRLLRRKRDRALGRSGEIRDKFNMISTNYDDCPPVGVDPEIAADDLQDNLLYRHGFIAKSGVTVRYSPLQDPIPARFQPCTETALLSNGSAEDEDPIAADLNDGVAIGVHDLIHSGGYVPAIIWKFAADDDSESGTGAYAVRLQVVVHSQCMPEGDFPFMTATVPPDPNFDKLPMVIENKDEYPVVVKGQSFKSFMKKMRRGGKAAYRTGVKVMKNPYAQAALQLL
jgi:hypothetical protein